MRFFTSDLHFGHRNVIPYCSRPWPDVEAMRAGLTERWNAVVGPDDDVFILGDYCFGGSKFTTSVNAALHGRKHLIRGNHDWKNVKPHRLDLGFASIAEHGEFYLAAPDDGWTVYALANHFPYRDAHPTDLRYEEQKPIDRGSYLLHGHVHQAWKTKGRMINVGVDVWDYAPVSEATLVRLIRSME